MKNIEPEEDEQISAVEEEDDEEGKSLNPSAGVQSRDFDRPARGVYNKSRGRNRTSDRGQEPFRKRPRNN